MRNWKRTVSAGMLILLLVSLLVPAVSASETVHWSGTYMMPDNNTVTTAPLPVDPQRTELVWDADVGNSTVVIVGDYVYTYDSCTATGSGTLYKIHKDTGNIAARLNVGKTSDVVYSYIVYGAGRLYVSIPTAIMAFSTDMKLLWTYDRNSVTGREYCPIQYVNGFVVSNGVVLKEDGTYLKTLTGSYSWANGVEVGGNFYVADTAGTLRGFDTENWDLKSLVNFDGAGAGVMHYNDRLYWGSQTDPKIYSVQLENGKIKSNTLISANTGGFTTVTTPVACGSRIYLAGTGKDAGDDYGAGSAAVCAYDAVTLEKKRTVYVLSETSTKIQSTPILRKDSSGGAVVSGLGDAASLAVGSAASTTAYIYVQGYTTPGEVYLISDDGTKTGSGLAAKLLTPRHEQYAWEQLACDSDGGLYITTDAGRLMKYQTIRAQTPVVTLVGATSRTYRTNETADSLQVLATVTDGGTLTYQWQKLSDTYAWVDISGAGSASYTPPVDRVGTGYYRCVVTNTRQGATAQTMSGIFTVKVEQGRVPGDVNGDDAVDLKDVTSLTRHLAGWKEADYTAEHADVNADGIVDVLDLVLLHRYVCGWNITLQ